MAVKKSDLEELMEEHHETPLDVAREYDAPPRPEKVHIEQQLETHLDRVTPDSIDVEITNRFKTTFAKLHDDNTLSVSYDLFESEEYYHYGDNSWEVITFVARLELENAGESTGDLGPTPFNYYRQVTLESFVA